MVTNVSTSSVMAGDQQRPQGQLRPPMRPRPNRPQSGWRPRRSALGRTDRRACKRPRSTMTPTIVLEHDSTAGSAGKKWAALGRPAALQQLELCHTLLGLSHLGLAQQPQRRRLVSFRAHGLELDGGGADATGAGLADVCDAALTS